MEDERYHELDEFSSRGGKKKPPVAKAVRGKAPPRHIDPVGQLLEEELDADSQYFATPSVRKGAAMQQRQAMAASGQQQQQNTRVAPPRFIDPIGQSLEETLKETKMFGKEKKKKKGMKLFKK